MLEGDHCTVSNEGLLGAQYGDEAVSLHRTDWHSGWLRAVVITVLHNV